MKEANNGNIERPILSTTKKEVTMNIEVKRLGKPNDNGNHYAQLEGTIPNGIVRARVQCLNGQFSHVCEIMVDGVLGHQIVRRVGQLRQEGKLNEEASVRECKNDVNRTIIEHEGNAYLMAYNNKNQNLRVIGTWYTARWKDNEQKEQSFTRRVGSCQLVAGPLYDAVLDVILSVDYSAYEKPEGNVLNT